MAFKTKRIPIANEDMGRNLIEKSETYTAMM